MLSAKGIILFSGLNIVFHLSKEEEIAFTVHDNNERTSFFKLNDIVEQDKEIAMNYAMTFNFKNMLINKKGEQKPTFKQSLLSNYQIV